MPIHHLLKHMKHFHLWLWKVLLKSYHQYLFLHLFYHFLISLILPLSSFLLQALLLYITFQPTLKLLFPHPLTFSSPLLLSFSSLLLPFFLLLLSTFSPPLLFSILLLLPIFTILLTFLPIISSLPPLSFLLQLDLLFNLRLEHL